MKKSFCLFLFVFVLQISFFSQNYQQSQESQQSQFQVFTKKQQQLRILSQNVRLVPEKDKSKGGYHLYIKKLPNVNSVLLTETTKDPTGKNDNYAYRASEYNEINGDEIRFLNGKQLVSEYSKYSLVSSTVVKTQFFDEAFHIYIPQKLIFGYPWSRNGEIVIGKGTFINIRSFEKPYADYSGDYMDNPFMFDFKVMTKINPQKKSVKIDEFIEPPVFDSEPIKNITEKPKIEKKSTLFEEPKVEFTDIYNPVASEKFNELSDDVIYSKGPDTIISDISKILDEVNDINNLDVVFAIDATGSMKNDIEKLKTDLLPMLENHFGKNTTSRVGLLFYRDYGDSFKYMNLPVKFFQFTSNLQSFTKNLNSIKIIGKEGGDIPEAVYEAMYASCEFYAWRKSCEKLIILIGDAEPHPVPRGSGKYSKDFIKETAQKKKVKIRSILLPKN